ncbi:PEP-CTERM sorting domain-containing protein [bacterium]|nr:PEP-CTERM sorting domain-containing protein [bacterium]
MSISKNGYGQVILRDNATWTNTKFPVIVGASEQLGNILMDQSSLVTPALEVGSSLVNDGRVDVLNGSSLTATNYLTVTAHTAATWTNTLVLNNGTITLGGGSVPGVLTNRGLMRAAGTIRGVGAGAALVRNEKYLEVGSSIGTLVLSNADLELAAGSKTFFEFSDTGLDQINVVDGWAKLDGTNLFSLAAGSATPTSGVKWGLGTYDFVLATGITAGVDFYASMTNLLGGYYLYENVDYRFGVMDLGGGLQALRLEFVPEPSTVMLLIGGGLVLWRFRRRNG